MRVLVIGSGGREHALCWKLRQSSHVETVFVLPGNPGMKQDATVVGIEAEDFQQVAHLCKTESIDLVVIGPERPLIAGLADFLHGEGVNVFGPTAYCAQIEGSKAFSKEMMEWEGVPTAEFATFSEFEMCEAYIKEQTSQNRKLVVKTSGEALGKGVIVCNSEEEALDAARAMLVEKRFGDAGNTIVVEERLEGKEISLIAICCGEQFRILPAAQDYKRVFDNDAGPNTGGMGAVSPPAWFDESKLDDLGQSFIRPILRRFSSEGRAYVGALFAGLMLTPEGPRALEYNCRFGDPETQATLPRIESDLFELLYAAARHEPLSELRIFNTPSVCVVVASNGYPGEYAKGIELPILPNNEPGTTFFAGVSVIDGKLVSSGGRVVNLIGTGKNARELAYQKASAFDSKEWHYRRDIGQGA